MTKLPLALCALALPFLSAVAASQDDAKSQETQETAKAPAHKLIEADRLKELLPEPPEGWKAERAETQSTSDEDEIHISTARRSYYSGTEEGSPVAAITIIDSTNNADYFDADESGKWEQDEKNEDGYDKRLVLDGMRVIEHFSEQANTGSLSVFVGNRYFVQIELTNEKPAELYNWLKRIDIAKLAQLK